MGVNHKDIVDANTFLHDSVTASRSGKDEDEPKFGIGQKVKLLEDIKNDGHIPMHLLAQLWFKKMQLVI